jgi:hypothetical protein
MSAFEAQTSDCAKSILGISLTLRDILLPWISRLERRLLKYRDLHCLNIFASSQKSST